MSDNHANTDESYFTGEVVKVLVCLRCKHTWTPRIRGMLPLVCSSCRSPYWNRTPVRTKKQPKVANGASE